MNVVVTGSSGLLGVPSARHWQAQVTMSPALCTAAPIGATSARMGSS